MEHSYTQCCFLFTVSVLIEVESLHQWEKLLGFLQFTCSLIGSKPIGTAQETDFYFLKVHIFKDDAAVHFK